MAKNIDFMGATFPDVPSIRLPQHEGGLVSFDDTTDATATADKILSGYTAYANGQKLVGTASGGITPSGTMSITSNGTYDVTQYASADVNVSGGGALNIGEATAQIIGSGTLVQSISFIGLLGTPKMAYVFAAETMFRTSSGATRAIVDLFWDGNTVLGGNNREATGGLYESVNLNQIEVTTTADTITFTSLAKTTADPGVFRKSSKTPSMCSYKLIYLY